VAYLKWLGKDLNNENSHEGLGHLSLPPLDRKADPVKGKSVFLKHCIVCHGEQGEGKRLNNDSKWEYPPLYGSNSYNTGAGLFRLSMFAAFVKSNMPFGTTYDNPVLTDEEAWDVAAYVNSLPRPIKDLSEDYRDINTKPFDYPFGPYPDTFPEAQHKFGPFKPILEAHRDPE
jgi:thiosulfate dehydrogenase